MISIVKILELSLNWDSFPFREFSDCVESTPLTYLFYLSLSPNVRRHEERGGKGCTWGGVGRGREKMKNIMILWSLLIVQNKK